MHMHTEAYLNQHIAAKRERGRRMAQARWKRDRERRARLVAQSELDPLSVPGRILQRVIVITDGVTATEIIRRTNTSAREWARLKRSVNL